MLLVGNSFTYYSGGLERHITALNKESRKSLQLEVESFTRGGASLKELWGEDDVHEMIKEGGYDFVVLQGDIPEATVEDFFDYGSRFVREVRDTGATPVFYMAWDYERLGWISMEEIAQAHEELAGELDVEIAPVGPAMKRVEALHPEIEMIGSDKEHQTIAGAYLAACIIFGTVFDRNPEESTYLPWPSSGALSEEEAAILRRIAREHSRN
jgi:hypothetical protein